jgi:glycerate dehydrogenase
LDDGTIAGAATDVFSREPIAADNPLLGVRDPYRLLLSPHNAWSATESLRKLVDAIADNIENYIKEQ